MMNFQETLEFLYSNLPMYQRVGKAAIKKDLTNTFTLCQHLDNPQLKFRSVHIAGTNGKGSSAHMLAAVFQKAGYKTGLYTSPHLKHFTERIKVNGKEVEEQFVIDFVDRCQSLISVIEPSFFEITVAMAFDYFARQQVDIAIVEVGLGGRLDSTNVLIPEMSLITNVSYDHQEMLGESLEQIAYEKAGIIKADVPVVIGELQKNIKHVFLKKAKQVNTDVYYASQSIKIVLKENDVIDIYKDEQLLIPDIEMSLHGKYQLKNLPGVLQVLLLLNQVKKYHIEAGHIREGLRSVQQLTGLKGRWQKLEEKPLVIADIAHNQEGLKEVVSQLYQLSFKHLYIVLGMVKEKQLHPLLSILPKDATYYFCQANVPRAKPADELRELAAQYQLKGETITNVNDALAKAKEEAMKEDVIFVGGSSFVVAELDNI